MTVCGRKSVSKWRRRSKTYNVYDVHVFLVFVALAFACLSWLLASRLCLFASAFSFLSWRLGCCLVALTVAFLPWRLPWCLPCCLGCCPVALAFALVSNLGISLQRATVGCLVGPKRCPPSGGFCSAPAIHMASVLGCAGGPAEAQEPTCPHRPKHRVKLTRPRYLPDTSWGWFGRVA